MTISIRKQDLVQLAQVRKALRQFLRFSDSRARAAGLTPQQHQMLLAIKGHPDRDWATPGEIAEALQVNHNAAVGLVTRAEMAKLVARATDDADRRRVRVTVTAHGDSLLTQLSEEHKRELRRISPALLAVLRDLPDERHQP